MKSFVNIGFFLLTLLLFFSCKNGANKIPYVYVDFTIDLNKPEYVDLSVPGGYLYLTGGFRGIVVYRVDFDEFKAYERACPYDPDCGRVNVIPDSLIAVDSCCGSEFSLKYDGVVLKGPAREPLMQYKAIYYPNSNLLRITNQYQ